LIFLSALVLFAPRYAQQQFLTKKGNVVPMKLFLSATKMVAALAIVSTSGLLVASDRTLVSTTMGSYFCKMSGYWVIHSKGVPFTGSVMADEGQVTFQLRDGCVEAMQAHPSWISTWASKDSMSQPIGDIFHWAFDADCSVAVQEHKPADGRWISFEQCRWWERSSVTSEPVPANGAICLGDYEVTFAKGKVVEIASLAKDFQSPSLRRAKEGGFVEWFTSVHSAWNRELRKWFDNQNRSWMWVVAINAAPASDSPDCVDDDGAIARFWGED